MKRSKDPLNDALRLLKIRLRSEWELRHRLKEKGHFDEEIETVIDLLKNKNFIDDKRFAYLYAYDSLSLKKKGPVKIRYELRQLHVDDADIEEGLKKALEEIDIKPIIESLLKKYAPKKFREVLYRHGFDYDSVAKEVIEKITNGRGDEEWNW